MKIRNYIIISGLLLFSIAPVLATNSIVPWSFSRASSSALSAMGSLGSSALSGISAFSTETKIATLGGLSMLTGGYLGYKYIKKSNDPDYQFRDWLDSSDLPRRGNPQLAATSEPSSGRRYSTSDPSTMSNVLQRPRSQSVSAVDVTSCIQSPQMLSENIQVQIDRLAVRSLKLADLHQLQRRFFTVQQLPQVSNTTNICGANFALAAIRAQERNQEVQQVMEQSLLNKITSHPQEREGTFARLSQRQLDDIREERSLEAQKKAKESGRRREIAANKRNKNRPASYDYLGDETLPESFKKLFEQSEGGFLLLDDEDCDDPHECLAQIGRNVIRVFDEGKWYQVSTDSLDPLLGLIYANKSSEENTVNIQNMEAKDFCEYFWYKQREKDKNANLPTYIDEDGALVIAVPQSTRQHHALPDSMSYIKLSPRKDGVSISFQEQEPVGSGNLQAYIGQKLALINNGVSRVSSVVNPYLDRAIKEKDDTMLRWKISQGNSLRKAALNGDGMRVSLALLAGADVNDSVNNSHVLGFTALHAAVKNGHVNMARKLLDSGANPNVIYSDDSVKGMSCLQLAIQNNNAAMVQVLADSGAELSLDMINKMWASSLDNPVDDVLQKLHVINHTYTVVERQLKALLSHLSVSRVSQGNRVDLEGIKAKFEHLYSGIRAKATSLNNIVQQAVFSPEDLFKKVHGEWKRNKLPKSFKPQDCYSLLGFAQSPVSHQEVVNALDSQLNNSRVLEENKKILRQVGYMLREESKRKLFDIYMNMTIKNHELLDMPEKLTEVSLDGDAHALLSQFNLDGRGAELFGQLNAVKQSKSAQYLTEIMGSITRTLNQ